MHASKQTSRWILLAIFFGGFVTSYVHGEDNSDIEARLRKDANTIASDAFEGRGLGTKGLDSAADYIAAEFERLGMKTDLFDASPFQRFQVTTNPELTPEGRNSLQLTGPEGDTQLELNKQFTPLALGGVGQASGELVFVGFGISANNLDYDEYANVDVKDKVVVILRKEPQQNDAKSKFDGKRPSSHALFTTKVKVAIDRGAKAVILINDRVTLVQSANATATRLERARKSYLEFGLKVASDREAGKEVNSEKVVEQLSALATQVKSLEDQATGNPDSLLGLGGAGDNKDAKVPVFFCKRDVLAPIIEKACGKTLDEIEKQIDVTLQPASAVLEGWTVTASADIVRKEHEIKNVVGVIEGEGPHKDETIVIGAHYDHVGLGGRGSGSLAPWTTEIHNGADDNASGTVTMLEVARYFATRKEKPSRRLMFIAFTAEERGLWGSAHYVRNPRFSLENTVAMYNLDMVGRLTENKLKVQGTGTAAEFDGMIESLNEKYGFKLNKDPSGFGPSDHTSFYRQKVPVLHFFTGLHNDYHRPSDDPDKLNIEGMRKVAQLVEDVVQWTLDQDARPEYRETRRQGR